ncbi:MAG: hypothetical protein V3V40_06510 [Nitrosomonadaceae bacterium]
MTIEEKEVLVKLITALESANKSISAALEEAYREGYLQGYGSNSVSDAIGAWDESETKQSIDQFNDQLMNMSTR